MTREGSGWLDINFSMSEPTPRSFVKIWAPLPQKCSVLSEYSLSTDYASVDETACKLKVVFHYPIVPYEYIFSNY